MTYNGCKNYETWAVALWIDNEEEPHKYRCQLVERAKLLGRQGDRTAQGHLADMLKDWITDNNPLADKPSVYSDLLSGALREVDWMEMAGKFLEE